MRRAPAIRNKHWVGKRASLKTLKRYCMEIWAELVKRRDGHSCVLCGATKYVQAHHLITRKYAPTRYVPECGVSLCAKCHAMGLVSVDTAPWVLYEWLEKYRPEQWQWFLEHRKGLFRPIKVPQTLGYYKQTLQNLLAVFEELYPQIQKTCKYTKFLEKEELAICADYVEKMLSRRDLACKYETNEQVITTILKRHKVKMRGPGANRQEIKLLKNKLRETEPYDFAIDRQGGS